MNVFVLNTGRCGSTTFIMACQHINNYSAGHETRSVSIGSERFDYPQRHIEADNRLSWLLGRLERHYGDNAFYVHLKRNDNDTARSFANRYSRGIIKAYREEILMGIPDNIDPMAVCLDYCHTINTNIEMFLSNKTNWMDITLENITNDFPVFWERIGATGDLDAAMREFDVRYNKTESLSPKHEYRNVAVDALRKIKRVVMGLPKYIREA